MQTWWEMTISFTKRAISQSSEIKTVLSNAQVIDNGDPSLLSEALCLSPWMTLCSSYASTFNGYLFSSFFTGCFTFSWFLAEWNSPYSSEYSRGLLTLHRLLLQSLGGHGFLFICITSSPFQVPTGRLHVDVDRYIPNSPFDNLPASREVTSPFVQVFSSEQNSKNHACLCFLIFSVSIKRYVLPLKHSQIVSTLGYVKTTFPVFHSHSCSPIIPYAFF